ncbi:hypothetical protein VTO73DRAFT_14536 [Trametes versicolor]
MRKDHAGSASSKRAPVTVDMSHTVQRDRQFCNPIHLASTMQELDRHVAAQHTAVNVRPRRTATSNTAPPPRANSPAALLATPSSFHSSPPSCVRKHGGQVRSIRTCQQLKETTSSPTQAPDCMLCGLDRSSLEVAPAGFIRAITKPGETWRTTTRSDAFPPPASGGAWFHIARAKTSDLGDAWASAPGTVLDPD